MRIQGSAFRAVQEATKAVLVNICAALNMHEIGQFEHGSKYTRFMGGRVMSVYDIPKKVLMELKRAEVCCILMKAMKATRISKLNLQGANDPDHTLNVVLY